MTKTPDLIDALVECATPVRRLRPPLVRAALWLLLAALVLVLIVTGHGLRPDIAERLRQPVFVLSMIAALMTGVLAAIASFQISLPDRSRWWLLLPAPALTVWLSTIGYGCLSDWVSVGPNDNRIGETVRCFVTLLLTSVPLSIAMLVMLRYAALLRPTESSAMSGLAVAAITAVSLSLVHDLDASSTILVWNLGVAVLIAGLACLFGRRMFAWTASRLSSS
ncbi:MAG TPA: DUF1109 domain-containing protein [Pseudolabrys sp.]|nr:DUF1109 domain-containing protein [Pseudolabrys sp.]